MDETLNEPVFSPPWFDPRLPPRERCVMGAMLEATARSHPDRLCARFEHDVEWTYAEALGLSRRWARGLQALGVKRGDAVLVWLPNGPAVLRTWFAVAHLGAIYAPINTAYRGDLLEHVIRVSGARVLVAHAALIPRLQGLSLGSLTTVVAIGDLPPETLPIAVHDSAMLDVADETPDDWPQIMPWETLAIIYTSGTTGPSKGVLCSHFHFYTVGTMAIGYVQADEVCMVHMPLFHIGAGGAICGALARGAAVAVVDGFSTQHFWEQMRAMNCATACGLVGSVVPFLSSRKPATNDQDQPMRRVLVAPVDDQLVALAARHGFEYFTGYGMSEAPIPLISELNPEARSGYCGRPRSGVQCRITDEHDIEVPTGAVGELLIRPDTPWSMSHGYIGDADATARAWRNGWFHTGDAFYQDSEGRYFFVDRLKDAIRRRGENISSLEVETVVLTHPAIVDAAAVPVPSEFQEDEVMIILQLYPDQTLDFVELIQYLSARMAHFMVPRYVRVLEEMPRTPTNKVRKPLLREQGITPDTWDREAAGIVLRRERLR